MDRGKCKGCGADIWWTVTEKGKKIPLNDPPEKRFVIGDRGLVPDDVAIMVNTYTPHHATCPEVEKFRKGKDQNDGSRDREKPQSPD